MIKTIDLQEFADICEVMNITTNIQDSATSLIEGTHPTYGEVIIVMDMEGKGALLKAPSRPH